MTSATAGSLTGTYTIDPTHSQIGFGARHAMITKVRGQFNEFSGTGFFDSETPANSNLQVTIQAKSINTNNADRDVHLRSNDFFSMDEFPLITFASTAFSKADAETYKVTGDLTIRGVSKSITFDLDYTGTAVDPYGNTRVGFEGKVTVDRKDWGINFNAALEAGGILVGEKINLEFEISAIRTTVAP
jgi:polyisoprenoid-binding protein YceI